MNIYPWISIFSCLFCAVLGTIVYLINRKRMLNKLFLATTLAGAYWAFTEFMMWQASSYETAYFWNKMGFLWPLFPAFVLHFSLLFTESSWLKTKVTYLLLYIPTFFFAFIDLATDLINGPPMLKFWGWEDTSPNPSIVGYASDFWTALLPILALVLCIIFTLNVTDQQKKRQSALVTVGFSIPIVTYIITNTFFPLLNIEMPNLGHAAVLAFGLLVGYSIYKYDLFSLDAALSADNILSIMPDSLVLADLNGVVINVNRKFTEFLGYEKNEVIRRHISLFGSESERFKAVIGMLKEKRSITGIEATIKTKTGVSKDVSVSCSIVRSKTGRDIGFTCIIHDITYLKETEKELANNKSYLETIMNSMLSGLVVIDGTTHHVIDANNAALEMIGLSREDFLGKVCHQFLCPVEVGKCPITDLGLNVEQKERILLDSNGKQKPILKNVIKVTVNDRPILIENFIDISERKNIEALLLKSERLASIGELAGQIGHDLRNPLTGIKGGIYLLKNKNGDLDPAVRCNTIEIIEDAIEDSNRIINSLLEYSADINLNLSSYPLNNILSSTIKKMNVPDRIKLVLSIEADLNVTADFERIETVFIKLLKNAVDAIPNAGVIQISAHQNDSEIEISFTDSGVGIPSDILPAIFTPLITTKAKGMGLGLAICKRIIDAHEGKIAVSKNDANNGTKVTILLPVKPKTALCLMATGLN